MSNSNSLKVAKYSMDTKRFRNQMADGLSALLTRPVLGSSTKDQGPENERSFLSG